MSEKNYHINIRGYYVKCQAQSAASCRRKRNGHIDQEQYQQLRKEGAATVQTHVRAPEGSPLYDAKQAYENTSRELDRGARFNASMDEQANNIIRKQGFTPDEVNNAYNPDKHTQLESEQKAVVDRIKQIYIDNGINGGKAHWLAQDAAEHYKKTGEWLVKAPKRDKYDADIKAKGEASVQAASQDTQLAQLQAQHEESKNRQSRARELHHKLESRKEKLRQKHKILPLNKLAGLSMQRSSIIKELEHQNKLTRAGVPGGMRTHTQVSEVTGNELSINKKGEINNLWAENADGTVTRIVRVEDGKLYGANKEEYKHHTHYHSYTQTESNASLVVTEKKGDSYTAEYGKLATHSSIDTGD